MGCCSCERRLNAFKRDSTVRPGTCQESATMIETNEIPEMDWVHLPTGCDVQSLWDCLHDGRLLSCNSDLLNRTACLEFDIAHLRAENEVVRFLLHFDQVTSVRANVFVTLPGKFKVPDGATREQEHRLIAEYQVKWREESIGWSEFEDSLESDSLSVSDSSLARTDGIAALKLNGHLEGEKFTDQFCTIYIRCGDIRATRSDGQLFSLEQFLDLGHDYWGAFAERQVVKDPEG